MGKGQSFLSAVISASGVGIIANAIGFLRQILIAAYFGVSRELDIYFMAYAIATFIVFPFGMIFDTVGIPHLVRTREEKGEDAFKGLTGSIFTFSVWFGVLTSLVFVAAVPVAARLIAAGFSHSEKKAIWDMAHYFLPWTLIALPYYALCSFYKSKSHFNIVFSAEVVISVFSVLALAVYHPDPRSLPIAYFTGHLAAFLLLVCYSVGRFEMHGRLFTPDMKRVYRNFFELFGANQIGTLSSAADRFFQSFLRPGGISAVSYSSQLTMTATGFLSFREIFIVPLSSSEDRKDRMERLVIGPLLLAMPVMIFLSYFAGDIITLLFKRGKFDAGAARMTAGVFSIYILSLVPATVNLPVFRMFQVIDRIKNVGVIYLFSAVNFVVFGSLLIFYLDLGVTGFAITVALNSYISQAFTFCLMHRCGIALNYRRILKYAAYSLTACLLPLVVIAILPEFTGNLVLDLLINGCIYLALVIASHLPIWKKLFGIVYTKSFS